MEHKGMSERRDNTTEQDESSPVNDERDERPAGSYYYDDATGYEIYDPAKDEDEEEKEEEDESAGNGR
jgi:hypothetical protein